MGKNPFSELAHVPEVYEVWLFGSRAMKSNSPDSDYDVALEVEGCYETEDTLYKCLVNCKLANPKLDMMVFTPIETGAIISSMQNTYFREHLIKSAKVVINDHKVIDKQLRLSQELLNYQMQKSLKENTNKWTKSYKRLSIPVDLLSDIAFALNRSRRYSYQIPYYLETEGLTESVKHQAQSMISSLKTVVGIGLRMANIEVPPEKRISKFFEEYNVLDGLYLYDFKDLLVRKMNTSYKKELIRDVNLARHLTEGCCRHINQDLEDKFKDYTKWKLPE